MLAHFGAFTHALKVTLIFFVADIMPWSIRKHLLPRIMDTPRTGMVIDETTRIFGGWAQFKVVYEHYIQQSKAPLKVGDEVNNIELVNLATMEKRTLKSLQRENIPLVLNFGSCT